MQGPEKEKTDIEKFEMNKTETGDLEFRKLEPGDLDQTAILESVCFSTPW